MAKETSAKLSVRGLALGIGLYWGLCILVTGWTSMFGWGSAFVCIMRSFYTGYEPTLVGSIIGGMWGFICGYISGGVAAFFYNIFRK